MARLPRIAPTLVLFCLLVPQLQAATVYKWVDAQGKTHFSDQAPPEHAQQQASTLELKGEVARDPEMEQYRERTRKLLKASEEERQVDQASAQKELEQQTARREQRKAMKRQCNEWRDVLKDVKEGVPIYELDDGGERRFLEKDQLAKYEAKLSDSIKENCD